MAIQTGDVKLVASSNMDDVDEGGGAPTATVIPDNASNAIFKDISESDRARGRVNMAKVAVSVQTDDTDTYLGANVVLAKPPADPNVSVTLFTRDQVYDTRVDARTRIESYLVKGPEWGGILYENHIQGQRAVQLFQRTNAELPAIGKTLAIVQNEGDGNEFSQYVRVIDVSVVTRTFTYNGDQDYEANIVTLQISDSLRYDFTGTSANRQFARSNTAARVRDTNVADATNYGGIVPLSQAASIGDYTLRVSSVYTQLVPSAQTETPMAALSPYGAALTPVAGAGTVTYRVNTTFNSTASLTLPGGAYPGSVSLTSGSRTLTDKAGVLMEGTSQVGTIDYANGILTLNTGVTAVSGWINVAYKPAAYLLRAPQSFSIPVTAESRAQNYTGFVTPSAKPGTLTVSYLVQGRWYVLSEDGSGKIAGYDASYGAGTYNFDTGGLLVTLGALPDIGSAIVIQWSLPTSETVWPSANLSFAQTLTLPLDSGERPAPGTTTITWSDGTATKTATLGNNGRLTGDATGELSADGTSLRFVPTKLPPVGTVLNVACQQAGAKTTATITNPPRNGSGQITFTLASTPVAPGSVSLTWKVRPQSYLGNLIGGGSFQYRTTALALANAGSNYLNGLYTVDNVYDDGAGKLMQGGTQVGTVNYSTGAVAVNPDLPVTVPKATANYGASGFSLFGPSLYFTGMQFQSEAAIFGYDTASQAVEVAYAGVAAGTAKASTPTFAPSFRLLPGVQTAVVAGSVALYAPWGVTGDAAAQQIWTDSGNGAVRERTASGWVNHGTINYSDGTVVLTSWPANVDNVVTRASLITTTGEGISSTFSFRTSAAPLRPGSLSIQFARATGGTQTVTAATDGSITGTGVSGNVDYQTGFVTINFGTRVTAAGNESEPWYSSAAIGTDGKIFKPDPVLGSTLRYSATAYSYLPLNADLIGIDPVRLPTDGRVPIFRNGTMIVVGNTQTTSPLTPSNGQTVNLGRVRLSRAVVRGSNGTAINSGYTVDLEAGMLTFTNVTGMATPVTIEHRIEDMAVVSDVQINGQLTLTRQITHAYATSGTYVSSALEFGDRKARVSNVFDQGSWDGISWSDSLSGAPATATYNTSLSPILVTNAGASTERWAVQFTSTSAFRVVGEHVGVIATGDINTPCSPINPATSKPYFTIDPAGWGSGWQTGNILRFNTIGALCPVWVVRTVQPGPEAGTDYSFDLLTRGDVDRP